MVAIFAESALVRRPWSARANTMMAAALVTWPVCGKALSCRSAARIDSCFSAGNCSRWWWSAGPVTWQSPRPRQRSTVLLPATDDAPRHVRAQRMGPRLRPLPCLHRQQRAGPRCPPYPRTCYSPCPPSAHVAAPARWPHERFTPTTADRRSVAMGHGKRMRRTGLNLQCRVPRLRRDKCQGPPRLRPHRRGNRPPVY